MTTETDDANRSTSPVREALHVLVLLGLIVGLVAYLWMRSEVRFQPGPDFVQVLPPPPPGTPPADCGPPAHGRPIVVEMLYSEEKRGWIEYAANLFARRCPDIQVRLTVMGDVVGAEAILSGAQRPAGTTDEKVRNAARLWLEFLREESIQRQAIEFGFRPADPAVKIREYHDDDNPFLRFRRYGVQFTAPLTEPPRLGGARVNQLLELWRDATGRN